MRFDRALQGYWLEKGRGFSPRTVADYKVTFKRFRAFVDDADVADISADVVRSFLVHLDEELGLGGKTRSNAWTALSSFWSWAEHELGIEHVIRNRVARPSYKRAVIEAYSEADVKAMLFACDHAAGWSTKTGRSARVARPTANRDKAIIVTLLDTGVRASELCAFEVRDYNERTGRLFVRSGKGDKDRIVVLGHAGRRAMWRYQADRDVARQGDPLLATRSNRHMDRTALLKLVQRMADRAGVAGATVHKFRHTFAVNFLRNGGNPLELQELLGHEDMETVRIYVRLAEVDLYAAQERASPADNWRL